MLRELRTSIRQLARSPVFAVASLVTLTLAIAAATTVFAVYNAVIYRPSLSMNWDNVFGIIQNTVVHRDPEPVQIDALRKNALPEITAFAARTWREAIVQSGQRALKTYVEIVNGDLAGTFKIKAKIGRLLNEGDNAGGTRSAVVSATLWKQWFGGREFLHGTETLRIEGTEFRIVGVMPVGVGTFGSDAWISHAAAPAVFPDLTRRGYAWTYVRTTGPMNRDDVARVVSAAVSHVPTASGERSVLATRARRYAASLDAQIFGLAALLMIAACANLTNLIYARITQRRTEIAVRAALGGSRVRVTAPFVVEVLVIAAVGTAAGYLLSLGAIHLIETAFPTFRQTPWGEFTDLSLDWRVAAFSGSIALACATVLSIVTAVGLARVPAARALASGAGPVATSVTGRRFRYTLVAMQVTVALVVVMGAGLWMLSARRAVDRAIDYSGFRYDTAHLATLRTDMRYQKYSAAHGAVLQERILDVARQQPGVEAAALTSGLPGAGLGDTNRPLAMYLIADTGDRILSGRPPSVQGTYASVSSNFLETLGLPLLEGRAFRPTDADGAPLVMMVSESVARMLFPGAEPLGQRILFNSDRRPREIVGVFQDPLISRKDRWMVSQNILVLVPVAQHYREDSMLVIRSRQPAAAIEAVSASLANVDPQLAVFNAASIEQSLLAETAPLRAAIRGMTVLGSLSLLFAALGIYGVMSFFVSTRLREFGIRLALGASPVAVLRHVFAEARLLLLFGLLSGVFLMAVAERVLDSRIYRLAPNAIETWIVAIALVLVTGLLATYFPARRASRTDPLVALREL